MSSPESHAVRQLRHDVDDVYELLSDTQQTVGMTQQAVSSIAGVQRRHGNRLEEIQQALDLHNGRLERVEGRLDRIDGRLEQVDSRFEQVDGRFEQVDSRFEQVDGRFEQVDGRLGRIEDTQRQILDLLRGRAEDPSG